MKAIVYEKYGLPEDVLQLKDVAKPAPKDNEVLVKIHAASVNTADWYMLTGKPLIARASSGLTKPKNPTLGADIAGRIEALGRNVQTFTVGDEVFADLSGVGLGGFAEYVCVPENVLAKKPASLTFAEAAAVPMAAITALQSLRDHGKIQAGQKVLINGASGGVGTFAVQLARHFGAEVTAVASAGKADMLRGLGAHHVIDYTSENFTQNGQQYDLILGVNGYHPLAHYKRALSPAGIYVATGGSMAQIFQAMLLGPLMAIGSRKKLASMTARVNAEDLAFVSDLLEAGSVKPVIDRCYDLSETAAALGYVGQKHAKGKVIINIVAES